MKKVFIMAVAVLAMFSFEAEARRGGFGRSRSYRSYRSSKPTYKAKTYKSKVVKPTTTNKSKTVKKKAKPVVINRKVTKKVVAKPVPKRTARSISKKQHKRNITHVHKTYNTNPGFFGSGTNWFVLYMIMNSNSRHSGNTTVNNYNVSEKDPRFKDVNYIKKSKELCTRTDLTKEIAKRCAKEAPKIKPIKDEVKVETKTEVVKEPVVENTTLDYGW